jgi:hypothetical protein
VVLAAPKEEIALEKKRSKTQLAEDIEPSDTDVVCGKGKHVFSHEGNRRFRQLVEMSLDRYSEANTRGKKKQVVDDIVEMVRLRSMNNRGGFVRQDETSGRWWEIGSQYAKEKVGRTIRESLMQNEPCKQAPNVENFEPLIRRVELLEKES